MANLTLASIIAGTVMISVTAVSVQGGRQEALFSEVVEVADQELLLHGQGVLRYKRLIPVYDAALYLPSGTPGDHVLGRVARSLHVVYRRGAAAKRFADAGHAVLQRNLPPDVLNHLQARLDQINALYPDPVKGDRCTLTYVPGQGTSLTFNGTLLGRIEGDDFANAYFSIWLGEDPASPSLRDDLLNPETTP